MNNQNALWSGPLEYEARITASGESQNEASSMTAKSETKIGFWNVRTMSET